MSPVDFLLLFLHNEVGVADGIERLVFVLRLRQSSKLEINLILVIAFICFLFFLILFEVDVLDLIQDIILLQLRNNFELRCKSILVIV